MSLDFTTPGSRGAKSAVRKPLPKLARERAEHASVGGLVCAGPLLASSATG
jgi:hypothetical protein